MEEILIPTKIKLPMVIKKYVGPQKFICTDYTKLSTILAERLYKKQYVHDFYINWTHCKTHPLIFNIVITTNILNTFDVLMHYFHNVFMGIFEKHICLSKFKILLSMRRDHSGDMHIHVLNTEMFHDDYVHLCNLMKDECEYITHDYHIELNCESRWCLVGCDALKKENNVYVPIREYHYVKLGKYVIRDNMSSNSENEMASSMMPISQKDAKLIYYPTRISRNNNDMVCAKFKSCINNLDYFIEKENILKEWDSNCQNMICYDFFKHHVKSITLLYSSNIAFRIWYDREHYLICHRLDLDLFQSIDYKLRQKCYHLKDDDSPLSTLFKSEYYLPVFYALCNLGSLMNFKTIFLDVKTLIGRIYDTFPVLHEFPSHLPVESTHLGFETILYCANKTASSETKMGNYYTFMEDGWDWIFESTESLEDLKHHILTIQNNFYPIVKCSQNENLYSWDPSIDKWLPMTESNAKKTVEDICKHMKLFNGFNKMCPELKTYLESDDWIEKIVQHILNDKHNVVQGNLEEITHENFNYEVYGWNIPQYYFFNYKLDDYDSVDA